MALYNMNNTDVPRTRNTLYNPTNNYPTIYHVNDNLNEVTMQTPTGEFTFRLNSHTDPVYAFTYFYSKNNYTYLVLFSLSRFSYTATRGDDVRNFTSTNDRLKDDTIIQMSNTMSGSNWTSNIPNSFDLSELNTIGAGATALTDSMYLILHSEQEIPDTDPYARGGSSGGGGGTGDFDGTSDTIDLPSLPSLSGLNTGFFTAFVPSASQMQNISNYLWNNALTDILNPDTGLSEKVDALKKIVANPYDAIMGCSIIPVTPPTAGSKELKMYGILETGISLPYASTRWVQVDCGTLNIHEFWGSYLDYSPYTKTTSLYLPYIGTVSIDIDLIMAKSLQVVYYVDILSGICVAFILVDGSVKFHYQGQCSTQVPITNADYSSVISAGIGLIGNASQVVGSAVTGGVGGGVGGAVAGAVAGAISQAPSIASNVMSAKPDIRSGGAIGSSAGILSVQRPYLIIERPKQSVPAFQNHFTGYPSNVTAKVSDLTGYTEFETINLDGIALTDAEKAELDNILKGGVYL